MRYRVKKVLEKVLEKILEKVLEKFSYPRRLRRLVASIEPRD